MKRRLLSIAFTFIESLLQPSRQMPRVTLFLAMRQLPLQDTLRRVPPVRIRSLILS